MRRVSALEAGLNRHSRGGVVQAGGKAEGVSRRQTTARISRQIR